jgi:hypothetical protein
MERQRELYHKCHRCVYRGRSADFVHEKGITLDGISENGAPKSRIDLPSVSR